ncbi:MAG: Peptidase propeptide and domain [Pseudomonadota bacterium]
MRGLLGLACLLAGAVVFAAQAVGPQSPLENHGPAAVQPPLSLDRAIVIAEQHFKARVVRAAEDETDGHRVYVLRLLSEEGRVWTVRVDAQTGAMS